MTRIKMYLGERRKLTCSVSSSVGEDFTIIDPTYTLVQGKEIADSGAPDVYEHEMTVFLEPKAAGSYLLTFNFSVGTEKLIRRVIVDVES